MDGVLVEPARLPRRTPRPPTMPAILGIATLLPLPSAGLRPLLTALVMTLASPTLAIPSAAVRQFPRFPPLLAALLLASAFAPLRTRASLDDALRAAACSLPLIVTMEIRALSMFAPMELALTLLSIVTMATHAPMMPALLALALTLLPHVATVTRVLRTLVTPCWDANTPRRIAMMTPCALMTLVMLPEPVSTPP